VDEIIDEKLDAVAPEGGFDVLSDFSIPLPIDVIGAILGVDVERRVEFREWSEGVIQVLNPFRTPDQTATLERSGEAIRLFREPSPTAVSIQRRSHHRYRATEGQGADLRTEIISNLIGLLVGGNLDKRLIGNGVYALLTHPDELAKFKSDLAS
jgi:cytochrome P450